MQPAKQDGAEEYQRMLCGPTDARQDETLAGVLSHSAATCGRGTYGSFVGCVCVASRGWLKCLAVFWEAIESGKKTVHVHLCKVAVLHSAVCVCVCVVCVHERI